MQLKTAIGVSLTSLLLAGCSMQPTMRGESAADALLKNDATKMVTESAQTMTGCRYPISIKTEVLRINPGGSGMGKTELEVKYGSVEERWVWDGCGIEVPFKVIFSPDGMGGTFINVSPEPRAQR